MKKFRRAVRDGRRIQRTAGAGALAALKGAALAQAAGHVVAKRTALGLVAMADPTRADQAEFARMVPEKMEAFGTSAMTFMQCSAELAQHAVRFASSEMAIATKATAELARCRTPAAAAAAQSRFATAWFFRAFSQSIAVCALAMRSYGAVMNPVHQGAIRNSRRLA